MQVVLIFVLKLKKITGTNIYNLSQKKYVTRVHRSINLWGYFGGRGYLGVFASERGVRSLFSVNLQGEKGEGPDPTPHPLESRMYTYYIKC